MNMDMDMDTDMDMDMDMDTDMDIRQRIGALHVAMRRRGDSKICNINMTLYILRTKSTSDG